LPDQREKISTGLKGPAGSQYREFLFEVGIIEKKVFVRRFDPRNFVGYLVLDPPDPFGVDAEGRVYE
jgi:hypothetical protein